MLEEADISRAILTAYHDKLAAHLVSDVIVAGAGPSGLMAGYELAKAGLKVAIVEKRLAAGGGIWGGAMGMNEVVIQEEALAILVQLGVRHRPTAGGLFVVDAAELASGLCLKALQAGAALLNLMVAEDVLVRNKRVRGLVVNRTTISGSLPVDPLTLSSEAVIDATGHDAVVVEALRRRGMVKIPEGGKCPGEGPMDAAAGEDFVVKNVGEVFPGLWVSGMSVCTVFGGPRMGPIFGGMLLSGKRVADLVATSVQSARNPKKAEFAGGR